LARAALEVLELDLEPGKEQQEGEAEQRQDLDRRVELDPAEHGGPDHDADHDLEHDRRQAQAREQPKQERRGELYAHDEKQAAEALSMLEMMGETFTEELQAVAESSIE